MISLIAMAHAVESVLSGQLGLCLEHEPGSRREIPGLGPESAQICTAVTFDSGFARNNKGRTQVFPGLDHAIASLDLMRFSNAFCVRLDGELVFINQGSDLGWPSATTALLIRTSLLVAGDSFFVRRWRSAKHGAEAKQET